MVTPTTLGLSQTLERELGSRKWDLKDTAKRDQWLLATKNALMEDPDAFAACVNGPRLTLRQQCV